MQSKWFWSGLALFAIVCAGISGFFGRTANAGFKDAASVIAFAGMIAVAIERLIECFWVIVDRSKLGGYWPLTALKGYIEKVETNTNALATGVLNESRSALEAIRDNGKAGEKKILQAGELLARVVSVQTRLTAQLEEAKNLAPGSARLTAFSNVASDAAREASTVTQFAGDAAARVRDALNAASSAASAGLSIIATFQSNPARRMASLLIGGSLGMLVTGFMGLNLFAAVLLPAPPPDQLAASAQPVALAGLMGAIGVVVTGFIVGLGSGPTHELVRTLEKIKESRNQTLVEGPVESVVANPGAAQSQTRDYLTFTDEKTEQELNEMMQRFGAAGDKMAVQDEFGSLRIGTATADQILDAVTKVPPRSGPTRVQLMPSLPAVEQIPVVLPPKVYSLRSTQ